MAESVFAALQAAVSSIDDYYEKSFLFTPEKSLRLVIPVVETIEKILSVLTVKQGERIKEYLLFVLQAMEKKDYVLVRDYLYYEIRSLLLGIAKLQKA